MLPSSPSQRIPLIAVAHAGLALAGLLAFAASAGAKVIYWEEPALLSGIWKLHG